MWRTLFSAIDLNGDNVIDFEAWWLGFKHMGMGQNLVPLVNIKIAGKWMFIPLKMVLIGIDPSPYSKFPELNDRRVILIYQIFFFQMSPFWHLFRGDNFSGFSTIAMGWFPHVAIKNPCEGRGKSPNIACKKALFQVSELLSFAQINWLMQLVHGFVWKFRSDIWLW